MEEGGQLFQHRNSGLPRKMRLNGIWDGFSTAWCLLNVANNEVRQVGRCMLTLLPTQQAPAGIVPPSNALSCSYESAVFFAAVTTHTASFQFKVVLESFISSFYRNLHRALVLSCYLTNAYEKLSKNCGTVALTNVHRDREGDLEDV